VRKTLSCLRSGLPEAICITGQYVRHSQASCSESASDICNAACRKSSQFKKKPCPATNPYSHACHSVTGMPHVACLCTRIVACRMLAASPEVACSVLLYSSRTQRLKEQFRAGAREHMNFICNMLHIVKTMRSVCTHCATCAPATPCKMPCERPRQRAGRQPSSTAPPGSRCTACSTSAPAPARSPPQSCRSPHCSSQRSARRACGPRARAQPPSRSRAALRRPQSLC